MGVELRNHLFAPGLSPGWIRLTSMLCGDSYGVSKVNRLLLPISSLVGSPPPLHPAEYAANALSLCLSLSLAQSLTDFVSVSLFSSLPLSLSIHSVINSQLASRDGRP